MLRRRMMLAQGGVSLPAGYTKIEYLESDGNSYIDTGVKATYQTRVVLDISDLTTVDTHIFGAKKADSGTASDQFSMIRRTSTTIRSDYFGTNASADMADTITRFTIDKDANVTKINGVVAITNTAVSSGASQYNMYLFGCNTANDSSKIYPSSYKLYSCKIYDNGVLVRDFIPCTNPDGISGLWDSVNNVFYKMLPADYTKLDFIESDGTNYIDTGYKPNNNTGVTIDYEVTSLSSTGWLFCGRTAANSAAYGLYAYKTSGKLYFVYGAGSTSFSSVTASGRQVCVADKNVCSIGDESVSLSSSTFASSANLCLFARNTAGTIESPAQAKLYSCQIYDNGTLVRDFIPAMNASGEAGLYDLKNDVWYALKPVVTKKENKITLSFLKMVLPVPPGSIIETPITAYEMSANAANKVMSTINIRTKHNSTVDGQDLSIPSGSFYSSGVIVPDRTYYIGSISPTEDDTYIYTF